VRTDVPTHIRTDLRALVLAVVFGAALAVTAAGASFAAAQSTAGGASPAAAPSAAGAADTSAAASGTAGSGTAVELSDRAYAIASELRCPVCTAESVADSNAQISAEMRTLIQQQLDAGKSEAQIIHYFRQRYGDWILLDPPKRGVHLLLWLLPVLALLGGVVALVLLVRRWRAAADEVPQADPEALARVRRALARGAAGSDGGDGEEHA